MLLDRAEAGTAEFAGRGIVQMYWGRLDLAHCLAVNIEADPCRCYSSMSLGLAAG